MDRRHFLKRSLVRGTLVATGLAASGELLAARPERLTRPGARRPLGKTGEQLSVLGFGGIVVMSVEQSFANNIVAEAVDAHAKRAWGTWRLRPWPRASIRRACPRLSTRPSAGTNLASCPKRHRSPCAGHCHNLMSRLLFRRATLNGSGVRWMWLRASSPSRRRRTGPFSPSTLSPALSSSGFTARARMPDGSQRPS